MMTLMTLVATPRESATLFNIIATGLVGSLRTQQVTVSKSKMDPEIFFLCEVPEIMLLLQVILFAGGSRYHLFGIRISV